MTQAQERALATVGPRTITDPREEEALTRDLILKSATPGQLRLVLGICNRYGFDPLLKHVVIVSNNIYVTRDGLLHLAHASGQFDGIEVALAQMPDGEWSATATVYRKDMSRPIRYTTFEREHKPTNPGQSAWGKYPRAMLAKTAEVAALRRAFDVSLGTAEEIGYDGANGRTSLGEARSIETEAPAQITAPVEAVALYTEAEFEGIALDLERRAADGEASKMIAAWLNDRNTRMTGQQHDRIATLWGSIIAARKAGEPWPHPDAAADSVDAGQTAEAQPAEDFGATEFWRWARGAGLASRQAVETALGVPIGDRSWTQVRAALDAKEVADHDDIFADGQPAAYAG